MEKFLKDQNEGIKIAKMSLIFLFVTSCYSCSLFNKEENDNQSMYPPIWETDFAVGFTNSINPVLYEDIAVFSPVRDIRNDLSSPSKLIAFNKENGTETWEWKDTFKDSNEEFYGNYVTYSYNNILIVKNASRFYAIDLSTGNTLWKKWFDVTSTRLTGYKNYVLSGFNANSTNSTSIIRIDIFTGKLDTLTYVNGGNIVNYTKLNNDEFLIINNSILNNEQKTESTVSVFSFNLDSILFEALIADPAWGLSLTNLPLYYENKLYVEAANKIFCLSFQNGQKLWETELNGNMDFSGFIIAPNGNIYANTEFGVYCLNPENGNIIWQFEGDDEGISSRMQYHQDVIYYIGGAKFNAIDATTGEKLLAFEAPSRADDDGAYFQPVMTIDHDNDRIYTASYTHAYCYPTLR